MGKLILVERGSEYQNLADFVAISEFSRFIEKSTLLDPEPRAVLSRVVRIASSGVGRFLHLLMLLAPPGFSDFKIF